MSQKTTKKIRQSKWEQYTIDMVQTDKTGLAAINQEVYDLIHEKTPGLYFYTTKHDFSKGYYKTGQVTLQTPYERISQQLTGHNSLVLIIGIIHTDKVLGKDYDQEIHYYLHEQENNGVEWLRMTENDCPGMEWSRYAPGVDPVEVWKKAIEGDHKRILLSLTIWQLEAVDRVLSYYNSGCKKVLEELAARFGKTTTMLAAFSLIEAQVMVVCAYYTTSFSSFTKEVYRFSQFENMRVLQLKDPDFKEKYEQFISQGNKVVVLATLHNSKNVEENYKIVADVKDKLVVTDEADYGSHTKNIAPKVDLISNGSLTILMTGTNSARAVGDHHKIERFASVTYFDMIAMARYCDPVLKYKDLILKAYSRNKFFESMIALPIFWQFDYSKYISSLDGFEEFSPSFSKASKDVFRARSFWHGLFCALIGIHKNMNANSMDIFNCLSQTGEEVRNAIQFVSMENKQMHKLKEIAESVLGDYFEVHVINGDNTSNEKAERLVKNLIANAEKKGKRVWLIASNMCQRSFSIPSINCTILTYDKGDKGATVQRISRGLTNDKDKTHSHIFSISIDSNRDEKINFLVLDAAEKLAEREDISLPEALRKVNKIYPIFQNDEDGYVCEMSIDEYTKQIVNSSNLHVLAIDKNNIRTLAESGELFDVFDGKISSNNPMQKNQSQFAKVKTFMDKAEHERTESEKAEIEKFLEKFYQNLVTIMNNFKYVIETYDKTNQSHTFESLINEIRTDEVLSDTIGTTPEVFEFLLEKKTLSEKFLSLFVESKCQ